MEECVEGVAFPPTATGATAEGQMLRADLVREMVRLYLAPNADMIAADTEVVSQPPKVDEPAVHLTDVQCRLKNFRALTVTGRAQNVSSHRLTAVKVTAMIGLDESSLIYETSIYPDLTIGNLDPGQSVRFKIITAGPSAIDPNSIAAKNYFKGCDAWATDSQGLEISYHVTGR